MHIRCGSHIGSSKGNSLGDTRFVAVDARPESVDGSADATLLLAVFDEDSYNKFIREVLPFASSRRISAIFLTPFIVKLYLLILIGLFDH
jgi:hypothetical protein